MKKNIRILISNLFPKCLFLFGLIIISWSQPAQAQCGTNTLTLQPDAAAGMDALITNYPPNINTTGGSDPDFDAGSWTISGTDLSFRSLIRFDLSSIPVNAIVQTATLILYNNPTALNGLPPGSHSSYTSSNAAWLQKISSSWVENIVTWNNQPSVDTIGQVTIVQSTSAHQDYNLDVKNLVQGMVNNPATNFGLMFKQQTEVRYGILVFGSSDNADATRRPKLVVTYNFPVLTTITANGSTAICPLGGSVILNASHAGTVFTFQWKKDGNNISGANAATYNATVAGNYTCLVTDSCGISPANTIVVSNYFNNTLTLQPDGVTGVDAMITNYPPNINTPDGNDVEFDAGSWTINSVDLAFRSLIKFDLSSIPTNALVQQAKLTLYNNPTGANGLPPGSHSSLTASNAGWLQKIIVPWGENTVTWNNQPLVDTTGQVAVSQSILSHQDYNIEMKNFVQNMVTNPSTNYGFLFRQQTEVKYGILVFGSSDNTDATKRPKLVVNYYLPIVPVITASGSTNICGGGSVALNASPTGSGISYQWKLNNVIINGAVASSYGGATAGNYTCIVTDPCGSAVSNSVTITQSGSAPATPGTITGNAKPCPGDTAVAYSVAAIANALTYNWTMPTGASISSGQGTRNIKVDYSALFINGSITVTASNACGTSGVRNKSVSRNLPGTPSAISGQTFGVCGITTVYAINTLSNTTTYLWTVPAGVTINNGQGTTSINVTFSSGYTTGIISVKAGNNCGYGTQRNLTVKGAPAVPGNISGPVTACANQTGVVYSIAVIQGAATYNWLVPSGATILSGQGTASITMKYGTAGGTVRVRSANVCGVSSYKSLAVAITCRGDLSEMENILDVSVYPNPSKNFFTININGSIDGKYNLVVHDMIGRVVAQWNKLESTQPFVFGNELSNGIYFVEIIRDDETKIIRLIKND